MAFNAKINLAKTYDAKSSNRSMIVKKLNKMLKDSKNEDFKDQIYFALAEIYLKDKNIPLAIENLTLSVATSVSNDFQKSLSALKLPTTHLLRLITIQQCSFCRPNFRITSKSKQRQIPSPTW